ncbi:MAG: hypothetical protein J6Y07_04460 [Alphaproteobacteria bacterium]|nr:hypothetical protein [Alphaproteobacteria bacterium]
MLKKILFFLLVPFTVLADDCVQYKKTPFVNIKNPKWTTTVELSDDPMDEYSGKYFSFKLHGTTETSFVEKYEMDFNIIPENDGYCIIVNGVDATLGYENFLVKIDKSHKKDSCSYNAVLKHEQKHIDAYLSILTDMEPDIKNSVSNAMNSVMPIFTPDIKSIDSFVEELYKKIESHPEIVLLHQKINAAQEIRNKRIDQEEDNRELKMCD